MPKFILFTVIFFASYAVNANITESDDLDFRVSGIIQIGANNFRGLIEFANGDKNTVSIGDNIGSWKIKKISKQCLMLTGREKIARKCLAGLSESEINRAIAEMSPAVKPDQDQEPKHQEHDFRSANKVDILQALDSLSLQADKVNMTQLSEAILPLVALDESLSIMEINAQSPNTVTEAIKSIRTSINQSGLVRLTLKSDDGQESIFYIQANSDIQE